MKDAPTGRDEPGAGNDDDEAVAAQRVSSIAQGRRIGGVAGAALAGSMLALRDVLEVPRDDRPVAVAEHSGEPHDVDRDGLALSTDDVGGDQDVAVPALPPLAVRAAERRGTARPPEL